MSDKVELILDPTLRNKRLKGLFQFTLYIAAGCADVRPRIKPTLADAPRTSAHPTMGAIFSPEKYKLLWG